MFRSLRPAAAAASMILLTAGLGGCHTQSGTTSSAGKSSTSVSIMVGGLDKVIYLPAELTARLGYFKDQGLNVTLQSQPSGASAETALVAHQVDAVVGFYDHTIDLQTKGKCIRSVVQFANVPGEAEVVGKGSRITSTTGLIGKKLGITSPGSSTDFLTQYLLGRAGATGSDYTTVTAGAGATFIAALQNGGIDAGMTTDPTLQQIKEKRLGTVLLDLRTEAGTREALGGLYPASSLYLDCGYIRTHPATVQKLANALVRTLRYISDHSGTQIAAAMPADYANSGGGTASYAAAINASKGMFNSTGRMDAAGARNVLQVLSRFNPNVKGKTGQVNLAQTYTTAFAAKALTQ